MPSLVYKVTISLYRINFTTCSLKFSILILQILEFCWTYKGEISWIKEEHAPFTKYICFANTLKFAMLERLHIKISYFFINLRHNIYYLFNLLLNYHVYSFHINHQ